MHVDLLGPLRVTHDNVDVTPSAPKLRQVFGLLVLCANTVVPHGRFIEELWDQSPPASVTTTLQTYIYQLRKALPVLGESGRGHDDASGRQPRLRTVHRGYTLLLSAAGLDFVRFEQMVKRGARQLQDGNAREAASTLRDGLRLWRGPAFSEVDTGPILNTERLRLEGLRKTALEHRIEADLILGRHYELIGELTTRVGHEPTNERLAGQLILALHRSHHRDRALRVYEHVRQNLAGQLGLDPSPELRRLHQAVLQCDETLIAPVDVPRQVVPRTPPPCQLPPRSGGLIGRSDETAAARAALSAQTGASRTLLVTGPPGSGKTALAIHVAYDLRPVYPDGQLFASLATSDGSQANPADVLRCFLAALGMPLERQPASLEELTLAFRSHSADRRILVVLDNVVNPDHVSALTPAGPGCAILISARILLRHHGLGPTVRVDALGVDDAVAMIGAIAGERRMLEAPETAKEVAARCDGLPVALQACAQQLRSRPHWSLDRLLAWIDHELPMNQGAVSLRASVERTYWALPSEAREVFGLFTGDKRRPLSPVDVAEALALDETDAESLLDTLSEAQLIDPSTMDYPASPRFSCLFAIARAGASLPLARPPVAGPRTGADDDDDR